ncbi:MAG TPA: AraC family transcriptional regulator [Gammaproteobacteria bacterium]|nr:AraC family transcriptional regulator [Gammaproteobacteria bacterium]
MNTISILNIGFSVISAVILFSAYLFFFKNVNKSWLTVSSCGVLLLSLTSLQLWHLDFLINEVDLFTLPEYRFWLFLIPPMFYFFSRAILLPGAKNSPFLVIHLAPLFLNFISQYEIAVAMIFVTGTGYTLWFANLIYSFRAQRSRFKFEMFFFAFFAVLAVCVLVFASTIPYIDNSYFYLFYTNCISFSFILIIMALLIFPDFLNELAAVATLSYASSALKGVNIEGAIQELENLMVENKLYQNENLNLAMVADEMSITGHQLSELINVHFGVSFSRYIRGHRVEAAKALLVQSREASVLSVSLETGFRSQSNFYAAFKEITNQSPGEYRKSCSGAS